MVIAQYLQNWFGLFLFLLTARTGPELHFGLANGHETDGKARTYTGKTSKEERDARINPEEH
jgi:hypothetical protein